MELSDPQFPEKSMLASAGTPTEVLRSTERSGAVIRNWRLYCPNIVLVGQLYAEQCIANVFHCIVTSIVTSEYFTSQFWSLLPRCGGELSILLHGLCLVFMVTYAAVGHQLCDGASLLMWTWARILCIGLFPKVFSVVRWFASVTVVVIQESGPCCLWPAPVRPLVVDHTLSCMYQVSSV